MFRRLLPTDDCYKQPFQWVYFAPFFIAPVALENQYQEPTRCQDDGENKVFKVGSLGMVLDG